MSRSPSRKEQPSGIRARLSRSQIRQRPGLAIAVVSAAIIAVIPLILSLSWLLGHNTDRVAVIGNFLSLATFLLALAAGIVALGAYSATTGMPALSADIWTPFSRSNDLHIYSADLSGKNNNIATIAVQNSSKFAARTPAVIVELISCWIPEDSYGESPGWTPIYHTSTARNRKIFAFQWEGGPNQAIYGGWERRLPGLNLRGLKAHQHAFIEFTLLADGYRYIPARIPVATETVEPAS